nr:hypothetical protein CFP56_46125 [Quercus suber]
MLSPPLSINILSLLITHRGSLSLSLPLSLMRSLGSCSFPLFKEHKFYRHWSLLGEGLLINVNPRASRTIG